MLNTLNTLRPDDCPWHQSYYESVEEVSAMVPGIHNTGQKEWTKETSEGTEMMEIEDHGQKTS